jgi:DHA1 family inner membrane transport protein
VFLLAYGAATAVGAFGRGRFVNQNASKAILIASAVLIVALASLYAVGKVPVLVALALVLWGLVGFGLVPSLQYRVVSLAGPGGDLASTLPASAINAGIAVGAAIGGWALANHRSSAPVVTGVVIGVIALPVAWFAGLLKPLPIVESTSQMAVTSPDPALAAA